jgi:lysophospholipase L1-like esterase
MKNLTLILLLCWLNFQCKTVPKPYSSDIRKFELEDKTHPAPDGIVLFIGSSSFTLWKDVKTDLQNEKILNRAFGGSTLLDVLSYRNEVIFAYKPIQIVMYCGENDLANSEKTEAKDVFARFKKLYMAIRKKMPDVPFVYISLKPSPSRWHLRERAQESNRLIKDFISNEANVTFIDIWSSMLDTNGYPKSDIYLPDSLHMNKIGYDIWVKKLLPVIK